MTEESLPLDPAFMDIALELARQSRPSPNPRVGAIVVRQGRVAGRGYHKRQGLPHAEVVAIEQAREAARGGDLYVTLEPCCHHGNTGPCIEAIARAGIARVVVGMIDPDPRVQGEGIRSLKQAGIEVVVGIKREQCELLLKGYTIHRTKQRPLITLKAALTLDGSLATTTGDSKWISSDASRCVAHEMRAEADAVLVGIETVLKDDPELTVRHCTGDNPLRIVMDSKLRIPPDSKLIKSAADAPVILAHTESTAATETALEGIEGVEKLNCKVGSDGLIDPSDLAFKLGKRGILSLLVEGGGKVHGAFARAGIADRVVLFLSPTILGSGLPWISFPGTETIKDGLSLVELEATPIAGDLMIKGRFARQDEVAPTEQLRRHTP
ncbi:MAG: bifunctional diaminohydroxyphosphoribosylaminopyrimidine deaminase/5-amino-6-(5-phosphoribosylamino)uracil reductase RibD [Proteobacteria bacterium]|nr:bifunctional diaminohydroxyphosphoribosylaminopyrimidine deaminase/5-amino-6-(5-phosphoribosylamino)uracil reductase RibD [Pseudomonadota bacterium]